MNKISTTICLILALVLLSSEGIAKHNKVPKKNNEKLSSNSSSIQAHIDMYFSLASRWLNDPSNQDEIQNYLGLARNVSNLIHIPAVRDSARAIFEDFFEVLVKLKTRLSKTLHNISVLQVNQTIDLSDVTGHIDFYPIWREGYEKWDVLLNEQDYYYSVHVSKEVYELYNYTQTELKNLWNRTSSKLTRLFVSQFLKLHKDDLNKLLRVREFLETSYHQLRNKLLYHLFKIEEGSKIINIIQHIIGLSQPGGHRLEEILRRISGEIAHGLDQVDLSQVKSLGNEAFSYLFEHLDNLQKELLILTDQALEQSNLRNDFGSFGNYSNYSSTSRAVSSYGEVIDQRLQSLQEGLGVKLTLFRDKALKDLSQIVRAILINATSIFIPPFDHPGFDKAFSLSLELLISKIRGLVNYLSLAYNINREYEFSLSCQLDSFILFICGDRSRCLLNSMVCDGNNDCPDSSDEEPSFCFDRNQAIQEFCNHFQCKDGKLCIISDWVCDGENDCLDGSDEDVAFCQNYTSYDNQTSGNDSSSENISLIPTEDIVPCISGEFRCRSLDHQCINIQTVCNGFYDCLDNSDEDPILCHKTSGIASSNISRGSHSIYEELLSDFMCNDSSGFINWNSTCNGLQDCPDASDEDPKLCQLKKARKNY